MASVDETFGEIAAPQGRLYGEVAKGFTAFRENDVLFAKITPCMENGKAAIARNLRNGIGFGSTEFHVLRTGPEVLPEWIFHYIRQPDFRRRAKATFRGAVGQQRVPADFLEREVIPVPPLDEQRRIVDILTRAEGIIRLQCQAAEKAREIIPALFLDMFGDPMTGDSRSPLVRFDSVTRRITYGFTCPMSHLNCGIPIVTAKNVLDGWINFENVHFADKVEFNALTAKSRPTRGDILVTKDGTIGRCAVVEVDFQFCINQSVALIQPNADKVVPTYLASYLLYPSVAHRLQSMGKGQALKHLQITEVAKLSIPLPPLRLQQVFADRVNDIRGIIAQRDVSHRSGDSLFQALLAQAFSG